VLSGYVPVYGLGPLVGLVVGFTLGLFCLTGWLIYRQYPPLKFAAFFFASLSFFFLGHLGHNYQGSAASIFAWYKLAVLGLIWMPMAWLWLIYSLRGRRPAAWTKLVLAWAVTASLAAILVDHPWALSSRLEYFAPSRYFRPVSLALRPAVYAVGLLVNLFSIHLVLRRLWPRSPRPLYVWLLVAGLGVFLLGGLHDAGRALGWGSPVGYTVIWGLGILLSLNTVVALSFHFRELNQELIASRENFAKAFQASPDWMCISTLEEGRILEANEAWEKGLGYSRKELVGHTTLELGLWPDPAQRARGVQMLKEHGRARDWEAQWRARDGQELDMRLSGELIQWGGRRCLLTVAQDITREKHAQARREDHRRGLEKAVAKRTRELMQANRELTREVAERQRTEDDLRASRANLQALVDTLSDSILVLDHGGRVLQGNLHAARLLGYALHELKGMHLTDLHPPDRREEAEALYQAILERRIDTSTIPLYTRHGDSLPVEGKIAHGRWGQQVAVFGIFRDVTERRRAEEGLAQLTAGVAHNFNNLLAAVLANAQAALAELDRPGFAPEDLRRLLDNVVQGAQSGKGVIKRLSTYVGSGVGEAEDRQRLDLSQAVRSALGIAQAAYRHLGMARVEVDTSLPPSLWVEAGRGELTEVLLNLIKNAVEAMPQGGRLALKSWGQGGGARLAVSDTGAGMDGETQARLFQPFFSTKGVQGQGLGLASSRGIVRSLGGSIEVRSGRGAGTTFTIALPLSTELGPAPGPAEPQENRAQGDIMLLEDEALVAMGIASILEGEGWRVAIAARVSEAKRMLDRNLPCLLLCDLSLPDGSGWEVVNHLQSLGPTGREVPVVLLTGWASEPTLIEPPAGLARPVAVLHKPTDQNELVDAVTRAVEARAGNG